MRDNYVGPPTFSLALQWSLQFFHSRIATDSRTHNIRNGFLRFLLLFLRSTLLLNRNKHIGEELLVFHKFAFPSTLLMTPWTQKKDPDSKKSESTHLYCATVLPTGVYNFGIIFKVLWYISF